MKNRIASFLFLCFSILLSSCSDDALKLNVQGKVLFEGTTEGVSNARVYIARAYNYEESEYIAIGDPELTNSTGTYSFSYTNDQRYDQLYLVTRYQGINDTHDPIPIKMDSESQSNDLFIPPLSSLKVTLRRTGSKIYEKVYFEHDSRSDKQVFFDQQFENYAYSTQFYGDSVKTLTLYYPAGTAEDFSYYFEDAQEVKTSSSNFVAPNCDVGEQCVVEIEY